MASAIIEGAVRAGVLDAARCVVAEPDESKRRRFARGVASASEACAELVEMEGEPGAGQLVLAVKPQMLGVVAGEIGADFAAGPGRVVVSILAGTPSVKIRGALGENARVVRVMPNTPAQIGRGMSAVCPGEGARPGDEALAETLMSAVGETVRLEEGLMDAFTALAGSGPAYVFFLAEAMSAAGEALGFSAEQSAAISRQVVSGAAELLARDARSAGELRAAVTSKGGTTAAACGVLDDAGLVEIMTRAITAARDRGRELAEG